MMIAESTPFGGIGINNSNTKIYSESDAWNLWFANVIDLIDRYDISMWCYINCDWDSQPMWHGIGFGDTRIASNNDVLLKWHDLMFSTNSSVSQRYLMAGSLENCNDSLDTRDNVNYMKSTMFKGLVIFIVLFTFVYFKWKSRSTLLTRERTNREEEASLLKSNGSAISKVNSTK